MTSDVDLKYRGTPWGAAHTLIPGSAFMGQPAVERLVDEESRRVDFDFRDDVATADLLRFRYREQHQRTKRAWGWGIPAGPFILLTIVQVSRPAGPAVTRAMELGMLGATALVAVLLLIPYNLW
ncbi:MAG: hypothetical protein ACRDOV_01155, partial [Streptomyces sp.]